VTSYFIKSGTGAVEVNLGPAIGPRVNGTVFAVNGPQQVSDHAAKIYQDPKHCNADKIQSLIDDAPSRVWFEFSSGLRYPQFAWPETIVYTQSEVSGELEPIGYLMPKVDPHATVTLDAYFHEKLAEINNLDPESLSLTRRLDVAISLCGLLADLHSKKIYCIDFNPKAILANRGFGLVTFLDCDGYSFVAKNGILHSATQYTKGYVAPEILKRDEKPGEIGEAQDCFALAVGLFQIFNYGIYPYSGVIRPGYAHADPDDRVMAGYYAYGVNQNPAIGPLPQSVHDLLPIKLRQLFDRAFTGGNARPTAKEWTIALSSLKKAIRWLPCAAYPNDAEHIHFDGLPCSKCERDRRNNVQKGIRAPSTPAEIPAEIVSTSVGPPPVNAATFSPPAPANSGGRGSSFLKYLAAGAIAFVLIYVFIDGSPPQQAPIQPRINPRAAIVEAMPKLGGEEQKPFTPDETYWCLSKSYQIDVINEILDKNHIKAPHAFQVAVGEYNARCEKYRYSQEIPAMAQDYFATRKASLADEAVTEAHQLMADAQHVSPPSVSTSNNAVKSPPRLSVQTSTPTSPATSETPRKQLGIRQATNQGQDYENPRPAVTVTEVRPASLSLLSAITRGDRTSVEYYLDKGISPNSLLSTGATPLKTAVVSQNVAIVEILLRRGADVNLRDGSGQTALYWAKQGNKEGMVAVLLRYGATE
jgi:hypothetical protein